MQFKIDTLGDSTFYYVFIPRVLKRRFRYYYNQGKFSAMEDYFSRINLGYTIIEVLDAIIDNMSIAQTPQGMLYRLDTLRGLRGTPYTYSQLVYLIDDGNMEVRGTHIIQQTINEVSYHQEYYLDNYIVLRRK